MTHYSASLYVGDLHPQVNESFLFDVFSEVGPIVSIKVCRDAMTGKSLGYAYVNFQQPKDAERALDTLNYVTVKGKPIRIMWSQRDPSIRRSGEGNVFIKNLDKSVDNKSLYDTFSIFGNILSCKVSTAIIRDKNGKLTKPTSLGYGFVHFQNQKDAENAISTVNGMLIKGKKVFVGRFLTKDERDKNKRKPLKFTNIYVNNISVKVDKKLLLTLFGKCGEITSSVIQKYKNGKQYAFINYKSTEAAQKAINDMNGKKLVEDEDLKCGVFRALKKTEREIQLQIEYDRRRQEYMKKYQGVNLYVKNLDDNFDESKLKKIFSQYGKITSAVVMKDDKMKSKGFGFVCFENLEEANKALQEQNGKMVGTKPLFVSVAQRKDVRKQFLMQQYSQTRGMQSQPNQIFNQGNQNANFGNQQFQQRNVQGKRQFNRNQQGPFNTNPRNKKRNQNNSNLNKRGYKYNQNARNRPDQQNVQRKVNNNQGQWNNQDFNSFSLSNYSRKQQERFLGERIYPLVHQSHPEHANKITGMLLEMDTSDILFLLENTDALNAKISEALAVLRKNEKKKKEKKEEKEVEPKEKNLETSKE